MTWGCVWLVPNWLGDAWPSLLEYPFDRTGQPLARPEKEPEGKRYEWHYWLCVSEEHDELSADSPVTLARMTSHHKQWTIDVGETPVAHAPPKGGFYPERLRFKLSLVQSHFLRTFTRGELAEHGAYEGRLDPLYESAARREMRTPFEALRRFPRSRPRRDAQVKPRHGEVLALRDPLRHRPELRWLVVSHPNMHEFFHEECRIVVPIDDHGAQPECPTTIHVQKLEKARWHVRRCDDHRDISSVLSECMSMLGLNEPDEQGQRP
jgi:hypothetical protein